MAKGIKLNREQYKNVKRMDHKQMETFVVNMYNAGYEDGKKTAGSRVKPSDIAVAISEIKGIGTKKAAEIMAAVNKLCEWNQEEIDELATETCECVNARIYTHKKSQKERAHNKIDLLFGENNTTVIVPDAAVDLLHKTVYPICEGFIQSATVDMGNGIKGKISITTKGIIKVTRTKTNTSTYEA